MASPQELFNGEARKRSASDAFRRWRAENLLVSGGTRRGSSRRPLFSVHGPTSWLSTAFRDDSEFPSPLPPTGDPSAWIIKSWESAWHARSSATVYKSGLLVKNWRPAANEKRVCRGTMTKYSLARVSSCFPGNSRTLANPHAFWISLSSDLIYQREGFRSTKCQLHPLCAIPSRLGCLARWVLWNAMEALLMSC